MKSSPKPVSMRVGKIEFVKRNTTQWAWRDTYHWLLTLSWRHFGAVLLGAYLLVNLLFATLYAVRPDCIDGSGGTFSGSFFFSVETLATVGYGHMYPATPYGHVVATLEIMFGMIGMAAVTGVIFVRFSRPTARFLFSRNLVIAPLDGRPTLMLRIANLRHQPVVDAEFRLMVIRNETTLEGEELRRFYPLPLMFDRLIAFPAIITLRHVIDEKSVLFGQTPADLEASDARFFSSIVCVDTVIPASMESHQDYVWQDVRFGHRFVEIYSDIKNGRMEVDYGKLHHTEAVGSGSEGAPAA